MNAVLHPDLPGSWVRMARIKLAWYKKKQKGMKGLQWTTGRLDERPAYHFIRFTFIDKDVVTRSIKFVLLLLLLFLD